MICKPVTDCLSFGSTERFNIDCGGLNYIIIRYENFFVLLFPVEGGHINFGFEPDINLFDWIEPITSLLTKCKYSSLYFRYT